MDIVYVVIPDGRERDSRGVLMVTTVYKNALNCSRKYLEKENSEKLSEFRKDKNLSDQEFLKKYDDGWNVSACIVKRKLDNKKINA